MVPSADLWVPWLRSSIQNHEQIVSHLKAIHPKIQKMSGNLERLPLRICLGVLYHKVVFSHNLSGQIKKIDDLFIQFWNYGHFYGLEPQFASYTL